MAFSTDLALPALQTYGKARCLSPGKLRSVAWYEPQCVAQVLHEVLLSHFIPAWDSTPQVHEASSIDAGGRGIAIHQEGEDRQPIPLTVDFEKHSGWNRLEPW